MNIAVKSPVTHAKWERTYFVFVILTLGVCVCAVSYTHLDVYKRQTLKG